MVGLQESIFLFFFYLGQQRARGFSVSGHEVELGQPTHAREHVLLLLRCAGGDRPGVGVDVGIGVGVDGEAVLSLCYFYKN